jgi:hypothetical protein
VAAAHPAQALALKLKTSERYAEAKMLWKFSKDELIPQVKIMYVR